MCGESTARKESITNKRTCNLIHIKTRPNHVYTHGLILSMYSLSAEYIRVRAVSVEAKRCMYMVREC